MMLLPFLADVATPAETHDVLWAAVVTGVCVLFGTLLTAWVTWNKLKSNREAGHQIAEVVRDEVLAYLDTGNGHSVGSAIARSENQLVEITDRLDRVEVKVDETTAKVGVVDEKVDEAARIVSEATNLASSAQTLLEQHIEDNLPLTEYVSALMEGDRRAGVKATVAKRRKGSA